ncbi:MAG: tyrosine recombinase XerD [Candidatus Cloacimonetes bacterium]|nr:tyrosine recombinase XerD [Candidatus Cloacimonadota bacterium]
MKNLEKISKENWSLINRFKFYLKVEKGLAENSINAYVGDIVQFAIFCDDDFRNVSPENVIEFLNTLYDNKSEDTTVARKRSSLKNFYKFLFTEKIIKEPIFEKFPSQKISLKLPNVLSIEEVNVLINSVKTEDKFGLRNRAMLEFLYSTGARISEMTNLRAGDFLWNEGLVRLFGKGRKERYVPISKVALKYCQTYLNEARAEFLKENQSNIMFLNRFGNKLSRMGCWKIFNKYVGLANIKAKVSPHTMRHSFATHLLQGGANLRVVQTLLGHTSISTTQIYTNIDRKYLKEIHSLYHPRA